MDYSLIYGGDVTVKDLQVLNKLSLSFQQFKFNLCSMEK